jgi:hypothetical protein
MVDVVHLHVPLEAFECRLFPPGHATDVKRDGVGTHDGCERRLRVELANRRDDDFFAQRIQHDELVRVKAQSNVIRSPERARCRERSRDGPVYIERLECVAAGRMRDEWQDLTVDAKRADRELVTSSDGMRETNGICSRDIAQIGEPCGRLERGDVAVRCLTKAHAPVRELTTESPANPHDATPQFRFGARCEQTRCLTFPIARAAVRGHRRT